MASSAPPRPVSPFALRALFWLLSLHAIAFLYTEFGLPPAGRSDWLVAYNAIGFLPLQLGTAAALWLAARRAQLPDGTRAGLRAIALGFVALSVGSTVWFAMQLAGRPLRYISWADLIFFQFYPFLIYGLSRFPRTSWPTDRLRDTLGLIVVLVAFGGLIIFAARVDATDAELTSLQRLTAFATGAAQLATLMGINRGLERARRLPSRAAVVLLLSCLAVSAIGDLVFQILYSTQYAGRNWNIVIAVLVNLGVFRAALRFLEDPIPASPTDEGAGTPFSPLPIVAVSALALLLVWMSTTGQATNLGGLVAGLVLLNATLVVRDVATNRAAAQAMQAGAQREAARRLEALVRHASDAILLLDERGAIAFASAPTDRLFGAPVSTSEGRAFLDFVAEPSRGEWTTFCAELRARPGQPAAHVWRLVGKDGAERLVESIGVDLRDEPAVRGTAFNLRDVTERLSLEDRLRQAQKLEVAGRLAGGVAHDFNNVLTAVMASAELAQLSLEPGHAAEADLDGIGAAARRGAALTRRLLAFVRNDPAPAQRVDVAEMLHELAPLLARLAGDSHPVVVRADDALGTVEVDRAELEHIVFNLVANARDAMPDGGPIEVHASATEVAESAGDTGFTIQPSPGRHAEIMVSDGGIGMSDDVRRRMFDPFFTEKSGGRGTGLGLIGVRPLVERARGGLRVDSAPGTGTCVALLLPLTAPDAITRGPQPTDDARASLPIVNGARVRRILLVEDELSVREQLARLLNAMGHRTVAVASAADARAALAAPDASFDAVISDVMMPGESGIGFATWLRRAHPQLPILMISGHTGESPAQHPELNESTLLRKPFGSAELADRLTTLFERSSARA